MRDPLSITREPAQNQGLDFAYLQAQGTEIIQQLSGHIWTDYNEHDPGVTILQQVCYAITELSYRASLPLTDLLCQQPSGEINPRRQALYRPQWILPCNSLTVDDYRRLIIDRLPEVANCWLLTSADIEVKEGVKEGVKKGIKGLYQLYLYVPDSSAQAVKVIGAARRLYHQQRNLSEDLASVCLLTPVLTRVEAKVNIDNHVAPFKVMARLLLALDQLLAPRVQRDALAYWLNQGVPSEDIFNGPLMLNGLIGDDQLQNKAKGIPLADMLMTLVAVVGVLNVTHVSATLVTRGICYRGHDVVPVAAEELLQLDLSPDCDQAFSITLYHNGKALAVNRNLVLIEWQKLLAGIEQGYDLAEEYEQYFAFPSGTSRDLSHYYSIQQLFPAVYGIAEQGVGQGIGSAESPARQAQIKQLKGYLLVFDQLLANYYAQLAHAKDLYSTSRTLQHSYFYQTLDTSVPNVKPLLNHSPGPEGYRKGLKALVQGDDPFDCRRGRFLDFLLAMYGQTLESIDSPEHKNKAKLDWLIGLIEGTFGRGRAMDIFAEQDKQRHAGMQIKTRIELTMGKKDRLYVVEHLLLRHCRQNESFDYNFTLTVVIAGTEVQCASDDYRRTAKAVVRRNVPAHLALHYLFLPPAQWPAFEKTYLLWREALKSTDEAACCQACMALQAHLSGLESIL